MFDVATNSDGNAAATAAYCRQLKRGGRGAAEGGSEEGSSHCDCDSVAHPAADADCDCV